MWAVKVTGTMGRIDLLLYKKSIIFWINIIKKPMENIVQHHVVLRWKQNCNRNSLLFSQFTFF